MSQLSIQSEETMLPAIAEISTKCFNMKRCSDSLRSNWTALQLDKYVWLTCRSRLDLEKGAGNWTAAKQLKVTQAYYTSRKAASGGSDKDTTSTGQFKYVEAAEFLSHYPQLMERDGKTPVIANNLDGTVTCEMAAHEYRLERMRTGNMCKDGNRSRGNQAMGHAEGHGGDMEKRNEND